MNLRAFLGHVTFKVRILCEQKKHLNHQAMELLSFFDGNHRGTYEGYTCELKATYQINIYFDTVSRRPFRSNDRQRPSFGEMCRLELDADVHTCFSRTSHWKTAQELNLQVLKYPSGIFLDESPILAPDLFRAVWLHTISGLHRLWESEKEKTGNS